MPSNKKELKKSYTKLMIGLATLIVLMFAMIAAIIVRIIGKEA